MINFFFTNLIKPPNSETQEILTPSTRNPKTTMPKYIIIKLLKTNNRENLKHGQSITYRGMKARVAIAFSLETMQA